MWEHWGPLSQTLFVPSPTNKGEPGLSYFAHCSQFCATFIMSHTARPNTTPLLPALQSLLNTPSHKRAAALLRLLTNRYTIQVTQPSVFNRIEELASQSRDKSFDDVKPTAARVVVVKPAARYVAQMTSRHAPYIEHETAVRICSFFSSLVEYVDDDQPVPEPSDQSTADDDLW